MAAKMKNLEDLFIDQLRDLYNAEKQITKALPKMAKAANSPDLKQGFEQHLEQTKNQVQRLEQIFQMRDVSPGRKKCKGMEGIISEAEELLGDTAPPEVMDAGLIANAQRVEHYEISGYGTARTFAQHLGFKDAATLLEQTLKEEEQTDDKLTSLAESHINQQAMAGQ